MDEGVKEEKEEVIPTKKILIAAPGYGRSFNETNTEIEAIYNNIFKKRTDANWVLVKPNFYLNCELDDPHLREKKLVNLSHLISILPQVDAVCLSPCYVAHDDYLLLKRVCDTFDITFYNVVTRDYRNDVVDIFIIPEDLNTVGNICEILTRTKSRYSVGDRRDIAIFIDNYKGRVWFASPHDDSDTKYKGEVNFGELVVSNRFENIDEKIGTYDLYIDKHNGKYQLDRFVQYLQEETPSEPQTTGEE